MSNERTASEYTVGWICALPLEMAAAKAMLDEIHPKLPQASNDQNSYCLGSINGHNIAIACLPSGVHGITSAATVASSMLHTFPSIRFGLMVGIGGGVPGRHSDKNDPIRLVILSLASLRIVPVACCNTIWGRVWVMGSFNAPDR